MTLIFGTIHFYHCDQTISFYSTHHKRLGQPIKEPDETMPKISGFLSIIFFGFPFRIRKSTNSHIYHGVEQSKFPAMSNLPHRLQRNQSGHCFLFIPAASIKSSSFASNVSPTSWTISLSVHPQDTRCFQNRFSSS